MRLKERGRETGEMPHLALIQNPKLYHGYKDVQPLFLCDIAAVFTSSGTDEMTTSVFAITTQVPTLGHGVFRQLNKVDMGSLGTSNAT
jgi:hypothetical protein